MLFVRLAKRVLAAIGVVVAAYVLAAVGSASVSTGAAPADGPGQVRIFVSSDGIHTDIVVPTVTEYRDWTPLLVDVPASAGGATQPYTAFGWGDRGFYLRTRTWADLDAVTALAALTGLNGTVIHMQAMATPWPSDGMRPVLLTGKQFQNLTAYLEASLARDDTGAPMLIVGEHYNAFDEFYAANGRYSAFTTCNEWARRGLAAAGIEMPLWAPFATAIFRWLPIRAHSG